MYVACYSLDRTRNPQGATAIQPTNQPSNGAVNTANGKLKALYH